jgi:hypothetical protein
MPSGEYGAGQIINFSVSFDREVIVTGSPLLPLNATRAAAYTHGSGTNALHFEFRVAEGDNLETLEIPDNPDVALMLPSHQDTITLLTNGAEPSPITADLIIGGMTNRYTQSIAIDTNPPTVIGISFKTLTTPPDGTYAVGDVLQFEVLFDKSVVVSVVLLSSFTYSPVY